MPGDDIKLYRMSSIMGPENSMASFAFAEGRYLTFLVASEEFEGQYAPLTDMSVLSVSDGSVTPIWCRDPDTNAVKIPNTPLEQAIADITNALDTFMDTEPSAQPDKKQPEST